MKIKGTVHISVDDVAIEQIGINKPMLVRGMPITIKASIAARDTEDFEKIWRLCRKHNQTIEYLSAEKNKNGCWDVTFFVRDKTAEEMRAA